MKMFFILIAIIVEWMYTYANISKSYTLNICPLLSYNYTSMKLLTKTVTQKILSKCNFPSLNVCLGFHHSSVSKESVCGAGDLDSIPGWGISPGEGKSNPFQYSCLENSMDRGYQS